MTAVGFGRDPVGGIFVEREEEEEEISVERSRFLDRAANLLGQAGSIPRAEENGGGVQPWGPLWEKSLSVTLHREPAATTGDGIVQVRT